MTIVRRHDSVVSGRILDMMPQAHLARAATPFLRGPAHSGDTPSLPWDLGPVIPPQRGNGTPGQPTTDGFGQTPMLALAGVWP